MNANLRSLMTFIAYNQMDKAKDFGAAPART